MYPHASEPALSLLHSMLNWDPMQRCTVEQALSHPYLAAFHNPAAEPVASAPFDFEMDEEADANDKSGASEDAREALFQMACRFRPQLAGGLRLPPLEQQKAKRSRQPSTGDMGSTGCTAGTSNANAQHSVSRHATADWPRYGASAGGAHARTSAVVMVGARRRSPRACGSRAERPRDGWRAGGSSARGELGSVAVRALSHTVSRRRGIPCGVVVMRVMRARARWRSDAPLSGDVGGDPGAGALVRSF